MSQIPGGRSAWVGPSHPEEEAASPPGYVDGFWFDRTSGVLNRAVQGVRQGDGHKTMREIRLIRKTIPGAIADTCSMRGSGVRADRHRRRRGRERLGANVLTFHGRAPIALLVGAP